MGQGPRKVRTEVLYGIVIVILKDCTSQSLPICMSSFCGRQQLHSDKIPVGILCSSFDSHFSGI